jgi:hypothetical protein
MLTGNTEAADVPHGPVAVTEMVPPTVPAVTEMVFEVEEPDHPGGNVHA